MRSKSNKVDQYTKSLGFERSYHSPLKDTDNLSYDPKKKPTDFTINSEKRVC